MALTWEGLIAAVAAMLAVPVAVILLNRWKRPLGWWLLAIVLILFALVSI